MGVQLVECVRRGQDPEFWAGFNKSCRNATDFGEGYAGDEGGWG
jgi:hypothetical protein